MLAICIDSIGDKSGTYKLLRNYSSLPFSLIQTRINNHDTVMEVDILDLDELKKVRELIAQLTAIGTIVTIKDSTGIISLEILNNIISTFEEIAIEREELNALMFEEEE
ncbi:50S ribosomal protein L7/L12 [Streptococcus sp. 151470009-6]